MSINISDSFKQLREAENIKTQKELSEITGIELTRIKSIESGRQETLSFDTFQKLYQCPRTKKYAEKILNARQ